MGQDQPPPDTLAATDATCLIDSFSDPVYPISITTQIFPCQPHTRSPLFKPRDYQECDKPPHSIGNLGEHRPNSTRRSRLRQTPVLFEIHFRFG